MAVDEAILESAGRGAALPTLRLYAWQPACLSLGYAQSVAEVDLAALAALGWHLVRRPTGGRAILHTDELTYSVCAAPDEPLLAGTVLESYHRLSAALMAACRALGLTVNEAAQPLASAAGAAGPVCFEVPSAYEIVADGKKLIGSAQARKREGILQHGTLPLTGDLTRITRALLFESEAARALAAQKLLARAVTVQGCLGREIAWETAAQAAVEAFSQTLGIVFQRGELSQAEQARAAELLENKYTRPEWTERV